MREIKIHGIYKHFKGDYYLVEELAKDSETLEDVVIYRKLYEDGLCFVRPLTDFIGEVNHDKYPNVKQKYKFEFIEPVSVRGNFKGEQKRYIIYWLSCVLSIFVYIKLIKYIDRKSKFSKEYRKNIYIISNDFDLLYRECDYLIIYSKNNIIYNNNRNVLYKEKDNLLNNNYELPKILQFIYLVESKQKIKLDPTFDIKELMKDIYRNV